MKKIVRLTESDLARIVRRVIKEESQSVNTVCLNQAGYKEEIIGGPQVRRIRYQKKTGDVLRSIDSKTNIMEKFVGDKKYECNCSCSNGKVTESNCKEVVKSIY
jgi:hypothetical protein